MSELTRTRNRQYETMHLASIERLDEYIEQLYSDSSDEKIQVARQLLYLMHEAESLEVMISHESLVGILARTLRDEYKKNAELSVYLSAFFFVISTYSQLHPILIQNQIGDTTMKIIELNIDRYEERKRVIENIKKKDNNEEELKKLKMLERKQNRLFWLCFSILYNLAEDIFIEKKMKRRGIIDYLVTMLDRENLSLLQVVFSFLKKLSVFAENKNEMHQEKGIVTYLQKFVPCPHHQELCGMVLRLVYNLSFDPEIREQFDSQGFVPRIVTLLKHAPFRGITIKILYQLSYDDKIKSTFTYTECIPIVYMLVVQFPEEKVGEELIGLAINLSTNPRNAEIMSDGNQLENLLYRALKYRDELLMKLVRNISKHGKTQTIQEVLEKHIKSFLKILEDKNSNMDFTVEVLGTLVNIDLDENWAKVLSNSNLLDFIQRHLVVGYAEDDIVLECIMLVGTVTASEKAARLVSNTLIIKLLNTLISEKQEDDEMVMQIMYTFHKMLYFKATRKIILDETRAVNYLLDLLPDKNPRLRKMADSVLSVVQEYDEEWREEIKLKRFQLHNEEWLSLMEQAELGEEWEESSEEEADQMHWADLSDLDAHMWEDLQGSMISY